MVKNGPKMNLKGPTHYSYVDFALSFLYVDHWIAMNVKLIIVQLLSTREKLDSPDKIKRTLELCSGYLEVYDKVSQGYTKWRGHILELQSAATLKLHQVSISTTLWSMVG